MGVDIWLLGRWFIEVALIAMIVPTFARTPMMGYSWIVLAAVGAGFLGFGLWVYHMFTTGLPGISIRMFSAASQAVAIPAGIQIFCFLATLMVGGKQLSERLGRVAFWLMLIGFNVAFLPMPWTGLHGMPRRVFTYPEGLGFETLNIISTVGAFVLAVGFLVFLWGVVRPKKYQPMSPRNPWKAGTLEWLD